MRKKKWQLRGEFSYGARLFMSALAFVLLVCASLPLLSVIFGDELIELMHARGTSGRIAASIAIALPVVFAYLASRGIFALLTYKRVEISTNYCGACGYNLTGNTTGRCPECGATRLIEFSEDSLFHVPSRSLLWLAICLHCWLFTPILYFSMLIVVVIHFYFSFREWVVQFSQFANSVGYFGASIFFIRYATSRRQREWAVLVVIVAAPFVVMNALTTWNPEVVRSDRFMFLQMLLSFLSSLGFYVLCIFLARRTGATRTAFLFRVLIFLGVATPVTHAFLERMNAPLDYVSLNLWKQLTFLYWTQFLLSGLGVGFLTYRVGREYRRRRRYERTGEWPMR